MQIKNFIGIDVSKQTLDISMLDSHGRLIYYQRIANQSKDIRTAFTGFMKEHKASYADSLFCMEYTGIYNALLVKWLQNQSAKIWMESGAQINKSQGLTRGKSDKVDSNRIAMYAFSNRHKVKIWQAPREVIDKIATLLTQRSRFLKAKKQLTIPVEEQKVFLDKQTIKSLQKHNFSPIKALLESIEKIEGEIMQIIKADERLCRLYDIVTSVDGVGMVTALHMITTTNEFLSITDAKKICML